MGRRIHHRPWLLLYRYPDLFKHEEPAIPAIACLGFYGRGGSTAFVQTRAPNDSVPVLPYSSFSPALADHVCREIKRIGNGAALGIPENYSRRRVGR